MIRRSLKAIELKKEDIRSELQELESRSLKAPNSEVKTEELGKKQIVSGTPATPTELRSPGANTIEIRQRIGYQTPAQVNNTVEAIFYTPR